MNVIASNSKINLKMVHQALLILLIISGFLMFSSEVILTKLRLNTFVDSFGSAISLCYIAILSYFGVKAMTLLGTYMSERWQRNHQQTAARDKAISFDNEERAILREFFLQRSTSLILPIEQEAVRRLEDNFILTRLHVEEQLSEEFARYAISHSARPFITSSNLRLPVEELTEEDIRYFKAARPTYIKEQLKRQWREQIRAQRRQIA